MKNARFFKNLLLFIALWGFATISRADDLEYRMEVGGMLGVTNYYGDANYSGMFKNMNIMGGFAGRYNINPRLAVKGSLAVGKISGNTADGENRFPKGETEFSRSIYNLSVQFECNFFAYGNGASYKGTRRFTPYISGGLGATFAPAPLESVFAVELPLGLGVKYKLAPRWNVGCELSYHFTFSDNLDVVSEQAPVLSDPYGIKSSGLKNKDSFSYFSIFVTYDISPKYRRCNN
jgi:hypothetical protein